MSQPTYRSGAGHSRNPGRDPLVRHLGIAFLLAALIYAVSFGVVQHYRTRKGGWELTFQNDLEGQASLRVRQTYLGISNVTFTFPGARLALSNLPATLRFDQPITNTPFGRVVYLDTTFLPGSLVLELFGHQVQLLPRTLLIDRRELPWQSGITHVLAATNASDSSQPASR